MKVNLLDEHSAEICGIPRKIFLNRFHIELTEQMLLENIAQSSYFTFYLLLFIYLSGLMLHVKMVFLNEY